jgi:hypothetical protein
MKVLWDDTVGSFLDPSGSIPVFPHGDTGAPSAGGGVTFGTQAVLWDQPGTPPVAGQTAAGDSTPDTSPSEISRLLWADPGNAPQTWNITDTWSANADPVGPRGFDGNGTAPSQPTVDAASLLWRPVVSLPQPATPAAQPTAPAAPQAGSPANTGTSAPATGADSGGCVVDGKWYPDGTNMIPIPGADTHWNQAPAFLECRDGVVYFQNTDVPWQPLTPLHQ